MNINRRGILKTFVATAVSSVSEKALAFVKGGIRSASNAAPTWQTLKVGGGGNMRGMDVVGTTLLARSDTHPALYLWDSAANRWDPLVTSYSLPSNYVASYGNNVFADGVWEARICPSTLTRLYMVYLSTPFVSTNSGRTWTSIKSGAWPSFANNGVAGWFEANGDHGVCNMAVDPANDQIVFVGSPANGLLKTSNGGGNWVVDGGVAAATSQGIGIVFDPTSSVVAGATQGIFAVSNGQGVWHSTNGGSSWTRLNTTGMPTAYWDMVVDQLGTLWITTGAGGALRLWTSETGWVRNSLRDGAGLSGIAVSPLNPNNMLCCSLGGRMYISTDRGSTWTTSIITSRVDGSADAPWQNWGPSAGYAGTNNGGYSRGSYGYSANRLMFDSTGVVYMAQGFGVFSAPTPFANPNNITYRAQSRGIEALDATYVIHPPGGVPIGTAWDLPIWRWPDYGAAYPTKYGPDDDFYANMPTYGVALKRGHMIDYASSSTNFLVGLTSFGLYYSSDYGSTWSRMSNQAALGDTYYQGACVASSSPTNHLFFGVGSGLIYTTDNGVTWKKSSYAGNGMPSFPFFYECVIAADRVTPGKFYVLSAGDKMYVSTDGGATFKAAGALTDALGLARVKCVPGNAGHVFVVTGNSLNRQPVPSAILKWSTKSGTSFSTLFDFHSVEDIGFGTVVAGQSYPTLYIAAHRASTATYGIYKCNNFNPSTGAGTWTLMTNSDGTNYPQGWFSAIAGVAGDPVNDNRCSIAYTNGGFKRYG
ncbi:WD40/YVTN/BNR-like repeat-containing protein [Bradyrhizobium sp. HKCCYLS1011]|uniref:WD40/YVTN/BNR-like repeat-containing protein n=1 Tax=Bradyrhizobium sp. HKCCYLS1011 TaxID=3420733 RepID=UPI003EBB219F